jgi:hypothetical protein
MHIGGVGRIINSFTLRDVSDNIGIPTFGRLFRTQAEENCRLKFCTLVVGYNQNVLIDSIFIAAQNGLLYYREQFHNPTSAERQ